VPKDSTVICFSQQCSGESTVLAGL